MRIHIILEPDISPDQLTELGLLAESCGIAGLWVQNYATAMDPFMSLVPLARASSRIRLGVVIVSPHEMHPLKMATSLLTLNEMSGGRASMVIGRGGEWLGVMAGDFTPRVSVVRDAVEIVRRAARGDGVGSTVDYAGKSYRAQYFRTPWIKQSQHARVYAGVTKDHMLQAAAECADGVMLADLGLPRVVSGRIAVIEKALADCGRPRNDFLVNDFVGWHVKEDAEATFHEARRELIIRAWLHEDWLREFLPEDEVQLVCRKRSAFLDAYRNKTGDISGVPAAIVSKLIDGLTITCPAAGIDKALERLNQFAATGLDEISLRLHDQPADSIRLIGRHVVPAFS